MDFSLTTEQESLREVARRFLASEYPTRRIIAGDAGPAAFADAARLGWFDPEVGMVERALLAEEAGYALLPGAWWITLALPESLPARPVAWARGDFTARAAAGDWLLDGHGYVDRVNGGVLVSTDDGLFTVDADQPGVTRTDMAGIDTLRPGAELRCAGAAAVRLLEPAAARSVVAAARLRERALLAAEAVGVARHAYDVAVAHARTRQQFGRPIGAFQAVAFAIADSYVRLELARSLAYRAAWLVGAADPGADLAVVSALICARQAAVAATEQALQCLGGLGMTWEHPLHHWYRRALWLDNRDRSTDAHLEAIAAALFCPIDFDSTMEPVRET
ncbi:acyl-CoA dehydrogenase [Luedemannella helvata]|uniref:Acyl-CoA dehydrogenase family protein n=1 Tax=Luedemannella helvata TaxID=349315 RepID=A0ABN2KY14_9ACTN